MNKYKVSDFDEMINAEIEDKKLRERKDFDDEQKKVDEMINAEIEDKKLRNVTTD